MKIEMGDIFKRGPTTNWIDTLETRLRIYAVRALSYAL